jgi:hypothetical protein
MWLMNVVKLRVEPSPTLKLTTQAVMRAASQWFKLGPRVCDSSHLRVHLEGRVSYPVVWQVLLKMDQSLS